MKLVQFAAQDRIGYITLNRPEKRNALSFELVTELKAAFTQAASHPEVKVIVLNAAGDVFCAGADLGFLQKLQGNSFEDNLEDSRHLKDLFLQIYQLNKVVIAQVQGPAIAGGCGLAAVCDFTICATEAKFGYTEVRIGFVPAIVTVFLIRKIGEQKAKQLLLSGVLVSAEEAQAVGLVNAVVPRERLAGEVFEFAQKLIRNNSGQSMEMTKRLIAEVQEMPLELALEHAAKVNAMARATEDCRKGVQGFLDKQDLTW